MTREKAISCLRRYRREETFKPTKRLLGWKLNYEFLRAVYERALVLELIQRIMRDDRSPLEIVRDFYWGMDDILCESERSRTWAFASIMENCAHDILIYLEREHIREKRRKNEDAKI